MKFSPLLICILSFIVLTGCDKPLDLEPQDNIAAILLTKKSENNATMLEWSAINHPGFEQYVIIRTDEEGVILTDSLQLVTLEVIFSTDDPSKVSFVDDRPVVSSRGYYQVLAEVNGRFIQSNVVKSDRRFHSFEALLFFGKIVGGDNSIFFIQRGSSTIGQTLSRYNMSTGVVEKSIELPSVINSRVHIAYGDFGSGKPEVVIVNNSLNVNFYDPITLNRNLSTSFGSTVEALLALPNKRLAFLYGNGNILVSYSRATNSYGTARALSAGSISSTGFMKLVPGADELIVMLQPSTLYKVSFDGNGAFTERAISQMVLPTGIFTGLEVDPRGEYIMPSRFGELLSINDFQVTERVLGDSSTSGNRIWGFSSNGNSIFLISNLFPSTMFQYSRQGFSLDYSQALSPGFFIEKTLKVDDTRYLVFRSNTTPFETILTPLPD